MIRSLISTEEQLVLLCQKEDPKGQKQVYDRYAGLMLSVCKRYMKSLEEAEEVMLTGFMKVFTKISQFNGNGSFEGWIRRIMVNESLNALKRKKMEFIEQSPEELQISVHEEEWQRDEAEVLSGMIENLPLGYRTVFNLYAIEGYGHKEIADMLNISENTSKSQLSKARKNLKKQIVNAENELSHG